MSINTSFEGKRILITGGSYGLGRGLVKKFHDGNALVFTVGRNEEALKALKAEFPRVTYSIVDLVDWDATRKAIESFGPMDYLVNNAGAMELQNFLEITKEGLEKQVAVNYTALINVSQVVVKGMIESKTPGSIVNISSISNVVVSSGVYAATKAAVTSATKNMAVELAPHNIRVNCICPGFLKPDEEDEEENNEEIKALLSKSLIKRPIETSEIAGLVCFLLSPLAAMMTGEAVTMDGGLSIG